MDPADQPHGPDPFETLGLAPRFDLARSDIERAYLAKAAQSHPDLARNQDAEAPDQSAAINRARAALIDPESRAAALLARRGGPAASEDRSLPDGFLAAMMTNRLQIEEAVESDDAEAIASWRAWAHHERAAYRLQLTTAFAELTDPPPPAELAAIRQLLNAWRYIERLIEQLPPDDA